MVEGTILGVICWVSMLATWSHLPDFLKRFTKNRPLLTDLFASFMAYMFLSSVSRSLTAVVGAVVCGVLVNFTILGYTKVKENE